MIGLLLSLALSHAAPVEGTVLQRGDSVRLAEITLVLPDGREVATDAQGRFQLDWPEGEPLSLQVQGLDHLPTLVELTPPLDRPLRIFLVPRRSPGEIVVEAFRPTSDLTRHHVDAEMAYETPGTYDDALRLVASLPGVNVQREYAPTAGEVSIRGSLAGDNRTYLDGIELPYLYHYNQYASVFPASQLADLELFSSTFGARYGDSTGAVIEAFSRLDRPEDLEGNAFVNTITAGADVRVPVHKRWWVAAGARRSFQDLFEGATAQYPFWPNFYDVSVRAEHQAEGGPQTGIFASVVGDRYNRAVGELDLLDPVEATQSEELFYRRDYQLLGARHTWRRGRLVGALLHDRLIGRVDAAGGEQDQRTLSLPLRLDTEGFPHPQLSWGAGVELRPEWTWLTVADPGRGVGVLVSEESPAMAWGLDLASSSPRLRGGVYGELRGVFGPLRLHPGVRVSLDSAGWGVRADPRLALRLRLADQTELRLAAGGYTQRPETVQLLAFPNLPTTRSFQVGGGLDQTVAERLEILLDAYGKWLDDVVIQPIDGPPVVYDEGRAFGTELTLRYRMRDTLFLWTWLAYARAQVQQGDGWRPTDADQPFSGGVVVSYNPWKRLDLAIRYRASSGLPFTPLDGSVYDATTDAWDPIAGTYNSARLPAYHKIDLRVAYTWLLRRASITASLDVWIVPKASAQLYPTWNFDYREQGWVSGPTFVPLPALRISF